MNVENNLANRSHFRGIVTIDGDEVSTEEQVITLTVVNLFSELPIGIRKYTLQDGNEVNLSGATFSLQRKILQTVIKRSLRKNNGFRGSPFYIRSARSIPNGRRFRSIGV